MKHSTERPAELKVAILAGGASQRMRSDKAFLSHAGRPFISWIAEQAALVSIDIMVVIGNKDRSVFEPVVDPRVRIVNDTYTVRSPLGGMLTAFEIFGKGYVAVLACDIPLVRADVIRFLLSEAIRHSAAVPRWDSGRIEPLCAVYYAEEALGAGRKAVESGLFSCHDMINVLRDVNYVPVSRLRAFDPSLGSLQNVNTQDDFLKLEKFPE